MATIIVVPSLYLSQYYNCIFPEEIQAYISYHKTAKNAICGFTTRGNPSTWPDGPLPFQGGEPAKPVERFSKQHLFQIGGNP
ncbi:MAG: hypothetical protein LUD69_07020 [Oscillospiraceae bacterium]|nr:hypothetical protein [Oscillospiraceae bacterium]